MHTRTTGLQDPPTSTTAHATSLPQINIGAMQAHALAAEGGHTRVNLHSLVDMHVVPLQDPQPAHHLQAGYNTLWVIPHFTVMSRQD